MKHETEAYLAAWSRRVESSNGTTDGWVKFYLPDDDLLDLLAAFGDEAARGAKKAGGKLFKIVIEDVEEMPSVELKPAFKTSQLAAVVCNDAKFYDFLKEFHGAMIKLMLSSGIKFDAVTSEKCAQVVRFGCSVESRAELDTNNEAKEIFNESFYQPFLKFKGA